MGRLNRLLGLKTVKQQLSFWISGMLMVLAILIAISFSLIGLNHAYTTALENMDETINVQNIYIEKWFQERSANIRNLANMPSTRRYDRDTVEYNLKFTLESMDEFDTIHFIDLSGHITISTAENLPVTDMSDREYFQEALRGNEYVTDVLYGRGTEKFIIVFSSPVFDLNNNVMGAVIGSVSLKSIDKIIDEIEVSQGKDIYIVNREGYMITESRFLEDLIDRGLVEETARMNVKLESKLYQKAMNHDIQRASYIDYRDEVVFGTYRWTNDGKWLIISEIDRKELLSGMYQQLYWIIASLLLMFALSIFVTLKFTKKIEEPINHLIEGASIIEEGNYKHRLDRGVIAKGPEELMILCGAFNEMSATIDAHMQMVQESEERYKALLYHNPDMVFSLDTEGNIQEINSACTKLLGYEIEEVMGKPFPHLMNQEKIDKTTSYLKKALKGTAHHFDASIKDKKGSTLQFNITLFPIVMKEEVVGAYAIAKNITQKKLAEAALNEYAKKLEQSNTDLQQFAYVASHDLQEPLRMVTSYLQLIERRYKKHLDEDAHEFIDYAVDGAKRMQILIHDLLAYSRLNTQGDEFQLVNCNEVLKKVLRNLELRIKEKGTQVTYDPLPTVLGDETQLTQLFQNLIANGIKFNDKVESEIHISVRKSGTRWVFSIKDNGIGIPEQYQERIFTIFQRLHTRDEYEGTGIGLAICKRIVERHEGIIWLESKEKEGTSFYFTMPIVGGEE